MATYIYETIPSKPSEEPIQFEIQHSMKDSALTHHPQTGQPIRRLITGGLGIMGFSSETSPSASSSASHGCGSGSCGCH
jgi:predicted nucleic acid-binding Zn ribbon protein